MIESITFNTAESKLIVTYEDGTAKEYTNATDYLADVERPDDVIAMGWEIPEGWEPTPIPTPEPEPEEPVDE